MKVHAYCMTAQVIYNKNICCERCDSYYKLFIKKERLCSGPLLALLTKYFLILLGLLFLAGLLLILDAFLKCEYAKDHPEEIEAYLNKYAKFEKDFPWMPAIPDHRKEFNVYTSVWWLDLVAIGFLLSILLTWCFFFHLDRNLKAQKKLIYV